MSFRKQVPRLDIPIAKSNDSISSIEEEVNADATAAPTEASGSGRMSRRPRPKAINLGQLNILKQDGAKKEETEAAAEAIAVQNYKLDLREEEIETLEELGTGAGGSVYRVVHKQTGTIMAKKVIHQLDAKLSNELLKELEILNKCHSPDIVSLFGAYKLDGQICICMEYMDVGSLEKIGNIAGKISENYLVKISVAVIRGLVYLFEQHRIIHRDIKPSNILLNNQGKVKICDFGVSGQLDSTLANTFVGTGAYMSPERIRGEKYSVQGDTWSLGLTLLELALGRYPFHPPGSDPNTNPLSLFELLQVIIQDPIPSLSPSEYSEIFIDFINKCLCKDGSSRPTPSWLLKHHPIIDLGDNIRVDMVSWARSFMEPNLNEKQMQRWSITKAQKRQSWINALERRRSQAGRGTESLKDGMAALSLTKIPGSPPVGRRNFGFN